MKHNQTTTLIALAVLLLSCHKEQQKTIMGLSASEINTLESKYTGLKFDRSKPASTTFSNFTEADQFFKRIAAIQPPAGTIEIAVISKTSNPLAYAPKAMNTGFYYSDDIVGGGWFSSFAAEFHYTDTGSNGIVDNFVLEVEGLQLGWEWVTTSQMYYADGVSGSVFGYAEYNYGIATYRKYYKYEWRLDPGKTKLYSTWTKR